MLEIELSERGRIDVMAFERLPSHGDDVATGELAKREIDRDTDRRHSGIEPAP